ncbi:MAG: sulfatase-like hydrolase/transferase [Betaproteobacteria bacterium]|nr:sulfatase-like hydrolase/transferase [Betaproteobacteria bacterium]
MAAAVLPGAADAAAARGARDKVPRSAGKPLNIVFIFTDQERYFRRYPAGLRLPGHERLARTGTTFHNHYCPAVMCTSSRAVLMTGLQTADNGMYENTDAPWVSSLSTKVPTLGHMLRKAGYYTAYKGKWHLNRDFESSNPDRLFTSEMDAYGFSDYAWPGDLLAHELGGFRFDHMIAGSAISWLRNKGRPLADDGKPWALTVSLVNPHDIMYFNADPAGVNVQDTGKLMAHAARAPDHPLYRAKWNMPVAASLGQPIDEPGRPGSHLEYHKAWGHFLGHIPHDEARWQRFNDFYLNSIRSVDAQVAAILAELDASGLADRTIVVFTSDHGEMGGAHGLRGKGAFAYEESLHIPLYVVHPDVKGGQDCRALTSHIDIAPSLLAMAGLDKARRGESAGRDLPGHDIGTALANPRTAAVDAVRPSILFAYSGLAQNDSELMRVMAEGVAAGKTVKAAVQESGFKPDLSKRGSMRTTFDGRHKFTRYFSPLKRNRPTTLDELYALNDAELFDLRKDPAEMSNLAARKGENAATVLAMNAKLNAAVEAEIGKDDGREMPEIAGISWAVDRIEL